MPTHYVLVDFENVQPDLSTLAGTPYKVKVFFGAKQQEGRVPFKLVDAMIALGSNVEAVKILRSGSNAVDMHIAYYVGRLIEKEPNASIHIISGDTDFDPLVEYLKTKGVSCKRAKTVSELAKHAEPVRHAPPKARPAPARAHKPPPARKPHDPRLDSVMKQLHSLSGKPATRKKLAQTIANYFRQHREPLADDAVEHLIDELIRLKYVTQNGSRVAYHLS
jgi:hypothetical protein